MKTKILRQFYLLNAPSPTFTKHSKKFRISLGNSFYMNNTNSISEKPVRGRDPKALNLQDMKPNLATDRFSDYDNASATDKKYSVNASVNKSLNIDALVSNVFRLVTPTPSKENMMDEILDIERRFGEVEEQESTETATEVLFTTPITGDDSEENIGATDQQILIDFDSRNGFTSDEIVSTTVMPSTFDSINLYDESKVTDKPDIEFISNDARSLIDDSNFTPTVVTSSTLNDNTEVPTTEAITTKQPEDSSNTEPPKNRVVRRYISNTKKISQSNNNNMLLKMICALTLPIFKARPCSVILY